MKTGANILTAEEEAAIRKARMVSARLVLIHKARELAAVAGALG